jgi:hypothetical protein
MSEFRLPAGLAVLLTFFATMTAGVWAQSVRGAIAGTVTDPSGAVIVGAKITATNAGTGATSTVESSSAGTYHFPSIPLGTYTLSVTAPGFSPATVSNVLVQIQSIAAQDVKLQPGTAAQTVTVNGGAQQLQSESSDLGGVIAAKQIVELPLALGGVGALRAPEAFVFLLPGSVGPGSANSSNGIFLAKTAGGQEYGNEVLFDGASQQRSENGSSFDEEGPSVEALQEFKVTTATPTAEYGRTTGGIENFVTKSGTNRYHGTAYDIFKNDDLDANTWFNNGYRATQCTGSGDTPDCRARFAVPSDKKNDFGGTLGGPVRIPHFYNGRDKLFFFFSWEQIRFQTGATETSTVPTLAERNGDFSGLLITGNPQGTNPCDGSTMYQGQIFDPATQKTVGGIPCRTAFPNNTIPAARFSTVAKNLLQYYPLPTNGLQFNNYSLSSVSPINNTTETIRIDYNASEKNKFYGSYDSRENNLTTGGFAQLPYPVSPNTWKQDFLTHFGRFGWDYVISPTLLNHFNFGYNRSNSINFQESIFAGEDWNALVGIGNAPLSKNFPQITTGPGGCSSCVVNLGYSPQNDDNIDNGWRFNEDVSWQKDRSSFKFGVDYRLQQFSPLNFPTANINFTTNQTAGTNQSGVEANTGDGFASELLGVASSGNFGAGLQSRQPRWSQYYLALFAQDDLKVSNNLTLNLGLRWSLDTPRHEAHNNTSNFSPTAIDPEYGVPGALIFGGTCHCNTAWADTYYKAVEPRLGFSYSLPNSDGNTVLRGGAAIFYGPNQYSDFGGSMNTGYKVAPTFPSTDGFSPAFNLDTGYPAYSQPPDLDPGFFNGQPVSGSYIESQYGKPAEIYEWDLQMQQQVASDLVLTIGYLGNKSQNLRSNVQNINNIPQSDFALGDQLSQPLVGNTAGVNAPFAGYTTLWGSGVQVQQALRPFPQYDYIDTGCCLQNVGMSSYEALLVSLERRFQNGLQFQISYTWSKTLTDADSLLPNNGNSVIQVQNVNDLHQEKAISTQDIPQNFVASELYELPLGKGKPFLNQGPINYVVGGWEVGGVQRYLSGQPVSFGASSGIPGFQNSIRFSRNGSTSYESPVARSGKINPFNVPTYGADPEINTLFNLPTDRAAAINEPGNAAFIDQNLEQYRHGGAFSLGNVPRVEGEYRLNKYLHEDFSLIKNTPIKGNLVFQFEVEALNAFNRHAFQIPDDNPNDQLFGVPTATIDLPRNLQITGRINF